MVRNLMRVRSEIKPLFTTVLLLLLLYGFSFQVHVCAHTPVKNWHGLLLCEELRPRKALVVTQRTRVKRTENHFDFEKTKIG